MAYSSCFSLRAAAWQSAKHLPLPQQALAGQLVRLELAGRRLERALVVQERRRQTLVLEELQLQGAARFEARLLTEPSGVVAAAAVVAAGEAVVAAVPVVVEVQDVSGLLEEQAWWLALAYPAASVTECLAEAPSSTAVPAYQAAPVAAERDAAVVVVAVADDAAVVDGVVAAADVEHDPGAAAAAAAVAAVAAVGRAAADLVSLGFARHSQ